MCIEPIELWLDTNALRRGLVAPVHPDTDSTALLVQDSGMVPVSTQICIVNPETNCLCHVGEFGEIWVQSEANVDNFYMSKDVFDKERFNGRTVDGDPNVRYMRTGDLGFLHTVSRPIGPGGSPVEMQILFVLGNIGETFEVNGLLHFPVDLEASVERCHRNIVPGGCAVFQAGGLVVVLVEIFRKNFLASIVPVIVNSILNHHHLIVDIVAFVGKGDFPRSRLGEKQRGKILAGWVTRKVQTIAQFCIREEEDEQGRIGQITEEGQAIPKQSVGSRNSQAALRPPSGALSINSSTMHYGTRMSQSAAAGPQSYQPDRSSSNLHMMGASGPDYYQPTRPGDGYDRAVELPAPLDIPELPSGSFKSESYDQEVTPTNSSRPSRSGPNSAVEMGDGNVRHPQLGLVTRQDSDPLHYSPIDPRNNPFAESPSDRGRGSMERNPVDYEGLAYNEARGSFDDMPHAPQSAAAMAATALVRDPALHPDQRTELPGYVMSKKPYMGLVSGPAHPTAQQNSWLGSPSGSPPGVGSPLGSDGSTGARGLLPSQMRRNSHNLLSKSQTDLPEAVRVRSPMAAGPSNGGLRIANRNSTIEGEGEDEWKKDALGYLGYAGVGPGHYGR